MPCSEGTDENHQQQVIELHWMKESDLEMHAEARVAVPALCGAWVEPDRQAAVAIEQGAWRWVRYASCVECDVLAAALPDALTA